MQLRERVRGSRPGRSLALGLVILGVLAALPAPAVADGAAEAGVQEYLVPGTQVQMLGVFNRLLTDIYGEGNACVSAADGTCLTEASDLAAYVESRVSIVAYADRSVVLLDAAANGFAGGYDPETYDDAYDLDRGQVITFAQDGTVERAGSGISGVSTFPLVGGNRIVTVGGPVLVMRAAWPKWIRFPTESGSGVSVGQILAESLTLYPTAAWGTRYASPMGVSASGDALHVDDLTTLALVQAQEEGTWVAVNGMPAGVLGRGGSVVLEALPVDAEITASRPVSVALVTSGRKEVDVRAFNLTPPALLDSSYVLPANTTALGDERHLGLRLYLIAYEPLSYGIYQGSTLVAEGSLGAAQRSVVHAIEAPTSVAAVTAGGPENSPPLPGGLRVEASGRLQVLAAFDSDRPDWDWGFPLVGARHLANEYFVPWAPGRGPGWPETNVGGYLGFGHPLHVSPVEDQTQIFADWDPWLDNGPEQSIILNAGEWATLVDPLDGDNTGAHLYGVRVGAAPAAMGPPDGRPEGAFAVAWGEGILADLADGYDLGYGLLPQKEGLFEKPFLDLMKVVEPEVVSPGDEVHVWLALTAGCEEVRSLSVSDTLPNEDFTYVAGSAAIYYPDGSVVSGPDADPVTVDGQTLTWELGESLPPRSDVVVGFRAAVAEPSDYSNPLPDTQVNHAEGFGEWCPFESKPCFDLRPTAFDNIRVDQATGTIKVQKKVVWGGATPDEAQTFTICVRPVGGGEEQCQEVDWDGGSLAFRDLPTGTWEVFEKGLDETEWATSVEPETVEVHGRCGAAWVKVVNKNRVGTGTLEVKKIVDWRDAPPDPEATFTVCIRGLSHPEPTLENGGCQQVGYQGGLLTWSGLQSGYYRVFEDPLPGPEWRVVGSGRLVYVGHDGHADHDGKACYEKKAVIKNLHRRMPKGKVVVKKVIDWNGFTPEPAEFEICLIGPAPETTSYCQTIGGEGSLLFIGLPPGTYAVTEDPGPGWEVSIAGSPVRVGAGRRSRSLGSGKGCGHDDHATVTNKRVEEGGGRLDVLKRVEWNGEAPEDVGFLICVAGPSYPTAPGSCQTVSFVASEFVDGVGEKTLGWPGLTPGDYTISEDPGAGWTVAIAPVPVAVVEGGTANGTVTNRRQRGRLDVTKVVELGSAPNPGDSFEICITGPSPSTTMQCQTVGPDGGVLGFEDLAAGQYTVSETDPGAAWEVSIDPAGGVVAVPAGGASSATVTNTLVVVGGGGNLDVLKRVDWNGEAPQDVSFTICVSGPSFPDAPGNCQDVSFVSGDFVGGVGEKSVSWTELTAGDYTISENPGAGWTATIAPIPVTVVAGETANGTVTNTRGRGRLEVTKVVDLGSAPNPGQSFEICITGPSPSTTIQCQTIGSDGGTLGFENLVAGEYTVSETDPGAAWTVTISPAGGVVAVPAGGTSTATVTNSYQTGNIVVVKQTVPAGDTTVFSFTASWDPDGFTLSDGESEDSGPLGVGIHSVSETPVVGWTTEASCSDGSDPAAIDLGAGETVTCTFTNTNTWGVLEVTKTVVWGVTPPSDVTFEICIVGPAPAQFVTCQFVTLLVGDTQETVAWSAPAGDYEVIESDPGFEWIVEVPPGPVTVSTGQTTSAGVVNSRTAN